MLHSAIPGRPSTRGCCHRPATRRISLGSLHTCRATSGSYQDLPISRRTALELSALLPFLQLSPASAQATAATAVAAAAAATDDLTDGSQQVQTLPPLRWDDVDFQLTVPGQYQFVQLAEPPREDTGPAPPPNPIKVRFTSPDGAAAVSVLVKSAQLVKPTFFQISDISQYGSPQDAAQLLLPTGSVVVGFSTIRVDLPPKINTLGNTVEVPPKNYYRYDFTTPGGVTVALSAAAQRGKVYVCTAGVPSARWEDVRTELQQAASSFRLKNVVSLF